MKKIWYGIILLFFLMGVFAPDNSIEDNEIQTDNLNYNFKESKTYDNSTKIENLFLSSSDLEGDWEENYIEEWNTEPSGFETQLYKKMKLEDKTQLKLGEKVLEIEIKGGKLIVEKD